ncbi:translation initiation factor eIF-1A [Candidatus Bathyarchaeota archaeon]|nr:translation initiation factor eIF-1A [Candidatus Bathyarchaeota archaeon]
MTKKKSKKKSYGSTSDGQVIRARKPKRRYGETLGIVTRILGNNRMMVKTEDGKKCQARVRGKLRKRMWVRLGDIVIVIPWDFQPEKGDIIHRYRRRERAWLERKGYLSEYLTF